MSVIINLCVKNEVNFLYSVDTFEDKLSAGFILFIYCTDEKTVCRRISLIHVVVYMYIP